MSDARFPKDFTWGVATSAYQIEGYTDADGRGESIWDRFAAKPGAIQDGTDGSRACEHYRRWGEDVALMDDLGVGAYRFSIAWPRVMPTGRGPVNKKGLDFYDHLVDALLERGIKPWATLYHWDLPQALQDAGGWPARETIDAFVAYADVVSRRLGDRVKDWITHNEPWCIAVLGHELGEHAPGHKSVPEAMAASHHLLVSHGLSVPIIRANSAGAKVGITLNLTPAYPASPSEADADAARRFDGWFNRWYLDPLYGRGYPEDIIADRRKEGHLPKGSLPWLRPGDLTAIATPTDFLGVNYYSRAVMRSDSIPEVKNLPRTEHVAPESEHTDMGWEVYPEGLTDLLVDLHQTYPVRSLAITENGAAYDTGPDADGGIHDVRRVEYLQKHLVAAHRAIEAGVPLDAYFLWSLLDNFEWAYGYTKRFGAVWVDYENQLRRLKESAIWYRDVAKTGVIPDLLGG